MQYIILKNTFWNRYSRKFFILALIGLSLTFFSPAVRADVLDNGSINRLYAEKAAATHDPEKMRQLMEKAIDANFSGETIRTESINGEQQPSNIETDDKNDAVFSSAENFRSLGNFQYRYQIRNIAYSIDHRQASVTVANTATGTIATPDDRGAIVSGRVQEDQLCIDTVMLEESELKITQSICRDNVFITR